MFRGINVHMYREFECWWNINTYHFKDKSMYFQEKRKLYQCRRLRFYGSAQAERRKSTKYRESDAKAYISKYSRDTTMSCAVCLSNAESI